MKNYIRIGDKKIPLSDETAKSLMNQFKEEEFELWDKPKIGNEYFYISSRRIMQDKWLDMDIDNDRLEFGNVFETEEEAIKERDRLKTWRRLKQYAKKVNEGWEPDWEDEYETKYYHYYKYSEHKWYIFGTTQTHAPNEVVFKERKLAQQAIDYFDNELDNLL